MPKHIVHPFKRHESCCDPDPPGRSPTEPDFGWAAHIDGATCHRCLDYLVRQGEQAVARIIALDTTPQTVPAKLFEPCDCGAVFHHAHDLPCQKQRLAEARAASCDCRLDWALRLNTSACPAGHQRMRGSNYVRVHDAADLLCHGMVIVDGRCPMCATRVDLQSGKFWRVEDAKFRT